ncbi:MAG: phage scaffolding protein [Oscillospiraceae bacterium]|nr:phage scaffolding protein [Oscillospiraceae bacterium]
MKLEDLTRLGIVEEMAQQVIALNEAEIAAEKSKLTDKEAELAMAADKINELTETVKKFDGVDVEKLKADVAEANKKLADETAALKLDNAIALALADSGALDKDIVRGQIDKSIVKLGDDGKLIGFTEQLEKLQNDKPFLFNAPKTTGTKIDTGIDHGGKTDYISDAQVRAVMGLTAAK